MRFLITGGTGSFGQAMTERLLAHPQNTVRILSRGELKQAQMAERFSEYWERLRFFIGDVRDKERLLKAMRGVDVVFHAAALKRIEVGEYNPDELVKTNVLGTMNVIECAVEAGVQKCVLISTDKAVDPSSSYGASKMIAERLISQAPYSHGDPDTTFLAVRYGNVAGSNGSVIPKFKELASKGQLLPVTHPGMTRFFITLDEALDLVELAVSEGVSGEIFVKRLPAAQIIRIANALGKVKITGVGPGEKMHECLISKHELSRAFDYGSHFIICPLLSNRIQNGCREVSEPFTSDVARQMTDEEIEAIL